MTSALDEARETLAREGLALPPVPSRFIDRFRVIEPWCFSTRRIDPMRMYLFDDYVEEVLARGVRDYVAFSHAGHGVNSYALTYQLVYGAIRLFVQTGWGGGYSDRKADTREANELFARCGELVAAVERGLGSLSSGRLIVIESRMRDELAWGWQRRTTAGRQSVRWLGKFDSAASDRHRPSRDELPTVAALSWLKNQAASSSGAKPTEPGSKSRR